MAKKKTLVDLTIRYRIEYEHEQHKQELIAELKNMHCLHGCMGAGGTQDGGSGLFSVEIVETIDAIEVETTKQKQKPSAPVATK